MIRLNNIKFTYDTGQKIINNINFTIKDGEVVLIAGISGSGKSTISKIINGLIPHYYQGHLLGNVFIDKNNSNNLDMVARTKLIGNVFQNPKTQFFNNDLESEIAFTLENLGVDPIVIREKVDNTILEFELEYLKDQLLHQMSGGQKQKIACASAVINSNKIIILDEPSSNLDYKSTNDLKDILLKLKKQGKTIIINEHRLYYLKDIIDRLIVINDGNIILDLNYNEILKLNDQYLNNTGLRSLNPFNTNIKDKILNNSHSLIIDNLRFNYGKKEVLNINNFKFEFKGVVGIIGPNGAGKTTFINTLAGILKVRSGSFIIDGKKYHQKELQNKAYIVSQDVNHQLFMESVIDELLSMKDVSLDKAMKILVKLGLNEKKDQHPMSLSMGEKQRLAIALAFVSQKQIIIFDEPTSGLDYYHMLQTKELLDDLVSLNKIVFVITHDIEFIFKTCNQILEINDGSITKEFILNNHTKDRLISSFKHIKERT